MSTTKTTKPEPSLAMLELQRERAKDRVFGLIIIVLMLCWTFSMYMVFSFFANVTSVGDKGTNNYIQDTSGDNNQIEQRG